MTARRRYTLKMIAGFLFSAASAAAATFGFVHSYVYTRDEGKWLEKRVNRVEENYREDIREVQLRLDAILLAVKR